MPDFDSLFQSFQQAMAKAADVSGAASLMNWDQEIHMPHGAAGRRASQLGTLAELHHTILMQEALPLAEQLVEMGIHDDLERLNVEQAYHDLKRKNALPGSFVAEKARLLSQSQHTWEKAKKAKDWDIFAPILEEVFDLKRREGEYFGYDDHPYDAHLEEYDPGSSVKRLDKWFGDLKPTLKKLVQQVSEATQVDDSFLRKHHDTDQQAKLNTDLLKLLGYPEAHARCDLSTHPFTTGTAPEDVRITTRIDAEDIQMMIFSTIHEFGHALYELGLRTDQYGLPAGNSCSLSIHESQSRIWENNICRSEAFMSQLLPQLQTHFPTTFNGINEKQLHKAVNLIQPSFIRIAADELTYHFHVIIRYELERDVFAGKLKVKDLPEAWKGLVKEYLGLDVPHVGQGALQDVHWSIGAVGYFPTYSLGSFYAAQFEHYMRQEVKDYNTKIASGDFADIKTWLDKHIFHYGKLFNSEDLCKRVTGEPLNVKYFLDYIKKKVKAVYGIDV